MTLVFSAALPCARLIATDQRYSQRGPNDTCLAYCDRGGKLIRIGPEFWISTGGTTGPIRPVLDELAAVTGPREAWRVLRRAAVTMPDHAIPATILIASPQGISRVMRGCFDEPTHLGGHWGVAPGPDQAAIEREKADLESLFAYPDSVTLGVLLRRVCAFFARIAELSPFVSPTMELALYDHHITGPAAELAAMREGDLIGALWRSPRPPLAPDVRAAIDIIYPPIGAWSWTPARQAMARQT